MTIEEQILCGIEYHGTSGATIACHDAVLRLLQYRDDITTARILTNANAHCMLLTSSIGGQIGIKSGFASGYTGTGPSYFSSILLLLYDHNIRIDECEVEPGIIERLDNSALTVSDFQSIIEAEPVRPSRWSKYINKEDFDRESAGTLWRIFRPIIPYAVVDERITDLALSFWEDPDDKLLKAYRRLEDIIRERTELTEHGAKLFSKAFVGKEPKLTWKDLDEGEKTGRANLFTGTFMAHRNRRAHRESETACIDALTEFFLLNHLYRLEKEAQPCPDYAIEASSGDSD